jgi:hypothetical protein
VVSQADHELPRVAFGDATHSELGTLSGVFPA